MRTIKLGLMCLIVLVISAGTSQAGVIFSTFGPGDSHSTGFSFDVTSPPANGSTDRDEAMGFSVQGVNDFTLTSIELAVINSFSNNGGTLMDVYLMSDVAGEPGSVIESFQLDLPAAFFGGILTASSLLNPILQAGSEYWLVASATEPNSFLGWYFDNNGFTEPEGPSLVRVNNGEWQVHTFGRGAFRVNGDSIESSVPEPSTIALLLTGGVGLIGYCWRRKLKLAA